ncbi:MAG TPA: ABC transporter ATP-binding protein [Papillibacter sp.]|nr:ABC transporter ATP-binding protein [Papillibacter sp.]
MIKIFRHLRWKEWLMVLLSLCIIVAQVYFEMKLPDLMKGITTNVQTPGSSMTEIWNSGIMMLLYTLAGALLTLLLGYMSARISARFGQRLRFAVFSRVEDFSMEEVSRFSTASLITRSTNDVTQMQMFLVIAIQMVIRAPIIAVWALGKISVGSWRWTALTGGAVVCLLILIASTMGFALPRFRKMQWLTDQLNRVSRENLSGIRVVRAYNAEEYQLNKFEKANEDITRNSLEAMRALSVFPPGMTLINSGLTLGIYWVGAYLIMGAADQVAKIGIFGEMIAFSTYAMMVVMAFMMLTILFMQLPRVMVSARRINEVLDTKPTIVDGTVTQAPEGRAGEIEFKNVSFKYPDAEEYVLHDISFAVNRGETVAFIGSTGSGKSTLINLVPRFYDVTEGQILIDGVDVRDYTLETLHNKIGYVPQRALLFTGTVASNVSYGDNGREKPTLEEIKKACEIAQAAEFIEQMEDGYDAHIAQGGTNVSGGQKQRLSIARAIARQPEIYIFDDSFSALDYKTDRVLRTALRREMKGATCLIVAQRIGTIRDADKIVVLDDGRLVGLGTHDELMENCPVYQEIAYSQLSKEELSQ